MFNAGVSNDALTRVLVPSYQRQSVIDGLKAKGVTQIGGKPVEDVIQSGSSYQVTAPTVYRLVIVKASSACSHIWCS
jgi:hypothetical protein